MAMAGKRYGPWKGHGPGTSARTALSRTERELCASAVLIACAVAALQSSLFHLVLLAWRLPLQMIRLGILFFRFSLYILYLLPAMLCGVAYWAFAGQNIISVSYKAGGGLRHTCDVYLPSKSADERAKGQKPKATAPVVVLVSGGAFIIGHKGYVTMLCRALRSVGVLCIAVDYRYWPQASVDDMVEDNDAALSWSLQNCAQYGGDPKRVTLLGLSSGAHVAALLLMRRCMEVNASGTGQQPSWSAKDLIGFVGLGGIYHFNGSLMDHLHRKGIDYFLQRRIMGSTLAVQEARSPIQLLRREPDLAAQLPPMLLVHGSCDKIVPPEQSQTFSAMLQELSADVQLLLQEGEGHNDPVIHNPLMSQSDTVRAIIASICRWSKGGSQDVAMALGDLPSWPRLPKEVIQVARMLTPI
mmetsp:Transcript_40411/g.72598  ORF Transcript_40411/g.72598 Transcript_40411/m.72598 type:complete len:413 (+) Transcript_40411:33-1271(+)|eukprot:CAMPEP_0197655696 /NCGR_PEP_ID=MMETSP1338-20131121/39611_1 /TAXON_ID=43686 ORGANISM="Pelagodinium beii, Strain RCC1491" /NCGR_SAMPLE_ID=MMETSP1338 /ASSEMBLY_ACC=CAM_ASM_000754 /LENGTH=412 /DNA_ID=CAMNT_0043231395 /DNA_START=31 /DNA_END=1269 /DNA_ORIENTATION=+